MTRKNQNARSATNTTSVSFGNISLDDSILAADNKKLQEVAFNFRTFLEANYQNGTLLVFAAIADKGNGKTRTRHYRIGDDVRKTIDWAGTLQRQGYGIFIMANPSNGSQKSFTSKDGSTFEVPSHEESAVIESVNRLWFDLDYGERVKFPAEVVPAYVINTSSSDGVKRLQGQLRLDREITLAKQAELNKRLIAAVGSDPQTSNSNRLLRLPYTVHQKNEPQVTTIVSEAGHVVSVDYLEANLPTIEQANNWIKIYGKTPTPDRSTVKPLGFGQTPVASVSSGALENKVKQKKTKPSGSVPAQPTAPTQEETNEQKPVRDARDSIRVASDNGLRTKKADPVITALDVAAAYVFQRLLTMQPGEINKTCSDMGWKFWSAFPDASDSYNEMFAKAAVMSGAESFDHYLAEFKRKKAEAEHEPMEAAQAYFNSVIGGGAYRKLALYLETTYGSRLSYSYLTMDVLLDDRIFKEDDIKELWLQDVLRWDEVTFDAYISVFVTLAKRKTINETTDYLNSVLWQEADVINLPYLNQLYEILHLTEENSLERMMVRKWLVSAVTRAFEPGCQADNILVLSGKKGTRKTTFFRELAPRHLTSTYTPKGKAVDDLMVLRSAWIHEYGEFDRVTNRDKSSELKNFLSQREDTYRTPYAKAPEKHFRAFVFGATTNHDDWMSDETGDRRQWVLTIDKKIDIERLIDFRDNLWAEVRALYERGERSGRIGDDLFEEAVSKRNLNFMRKDAVEETAIAYMIQHGQTGVTMTDFLRDVFDSNTNEAKIRATSLLKRFGFIKKRPYISGKRSAKEYWFGDMSEYTTANYLGEDNSNPEPDYTFVEEEIDY